MKFILIFMLVTSCLQLNAQNNSTSNLKKFENVSVKFFCNNKKIDTSNSRSYKKLFNNNIIISASATIKDDFGNFNTFKPIILIKYPNSNNKRIINNELADTLPVNGKYEVSIEFNCVGYIQENYYFTFDLDDPQLRYSQTTSNQPNNDIESTKQNTVFYFYNDLNCNKKRDLNEPLTNQGTVIIKNENLKGFKTYISKPIDGLITMNLEPSTYNITYKVNNEREELVTEKFDYTVRKKNSNNIEIPRSYCDGKGNLLKKEESFSIVFLEDINANKKVDDNSRAIFIENYNLQFINENNKEFNFRYFKSNNDKYAITLPWGKYKLTCNLVDRNGKVFELKDYPFAVDSNIALPTVPVIKK